LDEVNVCYPSLAFSESEIRRVDFGLVPFGESSQQKGGLSFGKQSRLIDHREHGVPGLISLISVRYTVARRDAVDALHLAEAQLGTRNSGDDSDSRPLQGGDCDDITALERQCMALSPAWFPSSVITGLVRNYGTEIASVMELADDEPSLRRFLSGTHVSYAEAIYSVRHEMAQRMTDVVFRRTELGTAGHPGYPALLELQQLLAHEFQWSQQRAAAELADVELQFGRYLAKAPPQPEEIGAA
jgi:glycerol-3-phosphate dehydrogenase